MPSLISKILHRKTPSSSKSAPGSPSSPGSPARRETPPSPSSPGSPIAPSSSARSAIPASLDNEAFPTRIRHSDPNVSTGSDEAANAPDQARITDQDEFSTRAGTEDRGRSVAYDSTPHYPVSASGRDDTSGERAYDAFETRQGTDASSHNAPFVDESERPQLPTTSSNVYNAPPSSDTPVNKALPSLPEVGSPFVDESALTSYPTSRFEEQSNQRYGAPPMPHVMDIDRSQIQQYQTERPRPVPAANEDYSAASANNVTGQFPHVQSDRSRQGVTMSDRPPQLDMPDFTAGQLSLDDRSTPGGMGDDQKDILARGTSLRPERPRAGDRDYGSSGVDPDDSATGNVIADLRSTHDPAVTSADHLNRYIANLSVSTVAPVYPEASIVGTPHTAALEAQRGELVARVAEQARARKAERAPLRTDEEQVFQRAGLGEFVGTQGSVEVMTNFMKPVVQEHIVRQEVTEITTIIDRDIHKYHIYPKIQPIADPNPTLLPVRHRIFSQRDGRWHEVVGDAAAIEILGEEAFRNGQQERREVRKLARPWPSTDGTATGEATMDVAENTGETEQDHVARGGRIIEREGVLGGQMGQWHQTAGSGPDNNGLDGQMGWDGLSGLGQAVKTVGIAI